MMQQRWRAAAACLASALAVSTAHAVVVAPGNMNGWTYYTTDSSGALNTGSGTADFVTGPATPPIGVGSGHLQTPAGGGDQSVQARLQGFAGTPLASLTSLSYSTYVTQWNGAQVPYLTVWLDLDGNGSRDDRLWFEPTYSDGGYGNGNPFPQAPVALNTWQTWNVLQGMVYNDNGPSGPGANAVQFSTYLTANPTATIIDAAPGVGGIRLATGFASASDNFNTYIDNFTIGVAGIDTNYDFEPAAIPEASALLFGGVASCFAGAAAWRRLRLRRA